MPEVLTKKSGDPVVLSFDAGTLLVDFAGRETPDACYPFLKFDPRVSLWRGNASDYAAVLRILHAGSIPYEDHAKSYQTLDLVLHDGFPPMPHQRNALNAWREGKGRGVVVMPTGSGKSYLALLAILTIQRSTLVIAPTIDLVAQWATSLKRFLKMEIGMLGGGVKDIREITVSTYDSAVLFMEFIGARFGLIVFDECHHLPGAVNRRTASMCLAPYRLGLTATPERSDDGEALLYTLVGPKVYEVLIDDLEGRVLAPYETRRIAVELTPEESSEYETARKIYTDFIRAHQIRMADRDGWGQFIAAAARMPGGRRAMNAYLLQRKIARCGEGKIRILWKILMEHRGERTIIFTADNESAYAIGNCFLFPVITHKTKTGERKEFLERFRSGEYSVIVTSKVLNEGVDVPEAAVGIVVSGSATPREHVQRLGRILRASSGKQALLYELVSEGTSEVSVSDRRRKHRAYAARHEKKGGVV